MSDKKIKIIIVILTILTVVNMFAIIGVTFALNAPHTSVQTEVLGAAFKSVAEQNVINIDLIRPPRKMAEPGEVSEQNSTITNTADFKTYLRASYIIIVEDGEGGRVEEFESEVSVKVNEGWEFKDGYWYYEKVIEPDDEIQGPIDSITYSEQFAEHRDYKVYVPLVVEGVEAKGNKIDEIDYWPNYNINDIDYKRLNESAKWTVSAKFQILG